MAKKKTKAAKAPKKKAKKAAKKVAKKTTAKKAAGKATAKKKAAPRKKAAEKVTKAKKVSAKKATGKKQSKTTLKSLAKKAITKAKETLSTKPAIEKVKETPAPKAKKAKADKVNAEVENLKQAEAAIEFEPEAEEDFEEEIVLTDAEGNRICRVPDCDQLAQVENYCRYHYLYFWKKIQIRKRILTEGKLERYIEELTARYPDKFLEVLKKDLRSAKDFVAAIQELELDESGEDSDFEDEAQNFIEEIRGVSDNNSRDDDDY